MPPFQGLNGSVRYSQGVALDSIISTFQTDDSLPEHLECSEREPALSVLILGLVGEAKGFAAGHWVWHSR